MIPESAQRVLDAARQLGLAIDMTVHEQPTRTAEEAAAACACNVGQIVKSLIFRGTQTQKPYLLLVSGSNRVNEKGLQATLGESLRRPDAHDVRALTGFAIGGIPPFGHAETLETIFDPDLLVYPLVWTAGGTPNCVFAIAPAALADATQARILAVT